VFRYLAKDRSPRFEMLIDVTAVDHVDRAKRFDVVYHLLSLRSGERLRVKAELNDDEEIPSATVFWNSADWAERETYDMYGLKFRGHPYMKRLLMWEGFDGWPLRKDFPLRGKLTAEEHYKEGDISRFRRL
jgi:NADH-quinone oxidoreductase subunit C